MKDTGYLTLWDVECVFYEEANALIIVPKDEREYSKLAKHFHEGNFILRYEGNIGRQCTAFIERVEAELHYMLKLYPRYIMKTLKTNFYTGFEVTGESLDDFFCPARFFYEKVSAGEKIQDDLLYDKKIAESWTILFDSKPVEITLSYGGILFRGLASDLKLHSRLRVQCEPTNSCEYIYRLYNTIMNFLKIVRYEVQCGEARIEVLGSEDDSTDSFIVGKLYDWSNKTKRYMETSYNLNYNTFKPYIQRILQFYADNPNYSFQHFPENGFRFRGRDYTLTAFMNLFAAFESECHADKEKYEMANDIHLKKIKSEIEKRIKEIPKNGLNSEEKEFIDIANARIAQIGTQLGQKKRITNAYYILKGALEGSLARILYLYPTDEYKNDKIIESVAARLVELRGKIVHGGFIEELTDVDAQCIRFLEILVYTQMLKRAGLEETEIERSIGVIFACNSIKND